jgi:hypothetical protein
MAVVMAEVKTVVEMLIIEDTEEVKVEAQMQVMGEAELIKTTIASHH